MACSNVFWWKITFWNTSGHIISHNVTCSKSSKSPLCFYHFWEFWILEKNHDFDDDFELVTLWPIIWPEVFQNVIFHQKTFLQALKTILHTLDDSLWCLEQVLKHHQKCSILLIFALWVPTHQKKFKKWWFFMIF